MYVIQFGNTCTAYQLNTKCRRNLNWIFPADLSSELVCNAPARHGWSTVIVYSDCVKFRNATVHRFPSSAGSALILCTPLQTPLFLAFSLPASIEILWIHFPACRRLPSCWCGSCRDYFGVTRCWEIATFRKVFFPANLWSLHTGLCHATGCRCDSLHILCRTGPNSYIALWVWNSSFRDIDQQGAWPVISDVIRIAPSI